MIELVLVEPFELKNKNSVINLLSFQDVTVSLDVSINTTSVHLRFVRS